ncbi:hypothetical protein IFM89_038677 [Coptis chinensis]|uniref:Cytochrome P450 n=1 Tax=Coptis chinensis TaxID=261450 RepID=A0A835I633_9MAGN|nr:hypothetical protein IFM89_038677 [Coptis chinensis]
MEEDGVSGSKYDKFLRDTILNFTVAGRDTVSAALTWFFWLLSKNPRVELQIIEELKRKAVSPMNQGKKWKSFDMGDLRGSVYLHGALCETLRLFPSVPFEHKRPLRPDILPSGHRVDTKTKILPLLYSMGRMEEVWGRDCLEFKPERWISDGGGIKYVPSYKFMAFNSGPRTCIGKEIAFTQMKIVVATLLYNYHVEVLEGGALSHSLCIVSSSAERKEYRWILEFPYGVVAGFEDEKRMPIPMRFKPSPSTLDLNSLLGLELNSSRRDMATEYSPFSASWKPMISWNCSARSCGDDIKVLVYGTNSYMS